MTEAKCQDCGGRMFWLSAWWHCERCGWLTQDATRERIKQELQNDPEGES